MTLLMLSWTRTARAMADGDRGSSLCWLVEDPSPLLCDRRRHRGQTKDRHSTRVWQMRRGEHTKGQIEKYTLEKEKLESRV